MTKGYLLSAVAIIIGGAASVGATQMTQTGAAFVSYQAGDAINVQHNPSGVQNRANGNINMIASVNHVPVPAGTTQYIYVDGYHSTTATTGATLYVYDCNGTYLGSASASASSVSGQWERTITVPSSFSSYPWAYYNLFVLIPGNFVSTINGFGII